MKEIKIKTNPFEFLIIKEIEIYRKINQHSKAVVSGYIDEELEDSYLQMGLEEIQMKIELFDEGANKTVLFCGIVVSLSIQVSAGLKLLKVELRSSTYLMDLNVHTRFFQDVHCTYSDVLKTISFGYLGNDFIIQEGKNNPIQKIFVQYQETDWEFLKRAVSRENTFLIPADTFEGIKYYMGMNAHNKSKNISDVEYQIRKEVNEYRKKVKNGLQKSMEIEETCVVFQDREWYKIGSCIILKGSPFWIYKIKSRYQCGEMKHIYFCKPKNGLQTITNFHSKISGVSLEGIVTEIEKDLVKVKIREDENIQTEPKQWFPYATVYSSPDGTGWYCMPEIKDTIRLYFPSSREEEAYVISAVHMETSDTMARSNPEIKSMKSKYGKEIRFTPESIVITNNNGMNISILDEKGVVIESDKSIEIKAASDIEITSTQANLTFMASEEVDIKQGGTSLTIDDNISFKGGRLKME